MFKSCDKLSGSYINYNHKLKATALKTICFKSLVIKVQKNSRKATRRFMAIYKHI